VQLVQMLRMRELVVIGLILQLPTLAAHHRLFTMDTLLFNYLIL